MDRHESISKPFINLKQPVVLKKKIPNTNDNIYLYMAAYLDVSSIKLSETDYIDKEKFSIYFCRLDKRIPIHRESLFHGYNSYSIIITKSKKEVSIELNNADERGLDIIVFLKGIGIGSIILNHLFYWAKEKYPNLRIPRLNLSPVDEIYEDNRERRDRLFKKIGLIGRNAVLISDLTPVIEARGFEIYTVQDFIHGMLSNNYTSTKNLSYCVN